MCRWKTPFFRYHERVLAPYLPGEPVLPINSIRNEGVRRNDLVPQDNSRLRRGEYAVARVYAREHKFLDPQLLKRVIEICFMEAVIFGLHEVCPFAHNSYYIVLIKENAAGRHRGGQIIRTILRSLLSRCPLDCSAYEPQLFLN